MGRDEGEIDIQLIEAIDEIGSEAVNRQWSEHYARLVGLAAHMRFELGPTDCEVINNLAWLKAEWMIGNTEQRMSESDLRQMVKDKGCSHPDHDFWDAIVTYVLTTHEHPGGEL